MQDRKIPNYAHDEKKVTVKGNQFLCSIEKKIEQLEFEQIRKLADSALQSFPEESDRINALLAWLKWVQSNEKSSKIWWEWVRNYANKWKARDDYILELWHTIDDPSSTIRKSLDAKFFPWSYYKNHFFHWFLARYNTVAARQIFNSSWLSGHIHLFMNLLSLSIVGFFYYHNLSNSCYNMLSLLVLTIIFMAGSLFVNIPLPNYLQSLMPRLAVTISIGYLFLMSASGLVNFLYIATEINALHYGAGMAIFISVWLYLILVIQSRVKPALDFPQALMRSSHLMLTAASYSAIGLLICEPVLFSKSFITDSAICNIPASRAYLFTTASIAMAIGVALQLVWEEKPVTDPL